VQLALLARVAAEFQSTPVIANGRIDRNAGRNLRDHEWFQSTPVIANGRISAHPAQPTNQSCFNPRPLLLTGESRRPSVRRDAVFRFNPRPLLLTGESSQLRLTSTGL